MIRRLLLLAALCALAPPAAAQGADAWRTDVSCTAGPRPALAVFDTLPDVQVRGCLRAFCVTVADGRRVCGCTQDTTIVTRVEAQGRTLHEWTADYGFAGPEALRVLHGDLDGDGRPELVVSELHAISNGLAVRLHELRIFDGADHARPPVRVKLQDFDPRGSFVRPGQGGECRLIATRWDELRGDRMGRGMYLVGQWMRYRDGRLEHDFTRPVVARRLLDSFAEARFSTPDAPFAHLAHRAAEARPDQDTTLFPPRVDTQEGHIRRVRGDTVVYEIPADREIARFTTGDFYRVDGWHHTLWLVDGATGRPYPASYTPSDPRWLDGVPVRVVTYADPDVLNRTVTLVFIRPPRTAPSP
jgi:hypothetical protein